MAKQEENSELNIEQRSEGGTVSEVKKICGIIRPISKHPDYPISHWDEVHNILTEALESTDFTPRLVSDGEDIGIIHERIVTNIYADEMIICDVSSKNPNVMFELGMRLAFDKPVVIIQDDLTNYSFDISPIQHLNYPSSLRFSEINRFKKELASRVIATYKKSIEIDYSPFLKNFGKTIIPTKIKGQEISQLDYLVDKMNSLSLDVERALRVNSVVKPAVLFDKDILDKFTTDLTRYLTEFLNVNPDANFSDFLSKLIISNYSYPDLPKEVIIRERLRIWNNNSDRKVQL